MTSTTLWKHVSSDKKAWWFRVYIERILLPSFMGIRINHYKNPYEAAMIQWKVSEGYFFFRGSVQVFAFQESTYFFACVL